MNIIAIIDKKSKGKVLSRKEIEYFIHGYTNGIIPDYQVSSLLMAIKLKGMNRNETVNLTRAMLHSGDVNDLVETLVAMDDELDSENALPYLIQLFEENNSKD